MFKIIKEKYQSNNYVEEVFVKTKIIIGSSFMENMNHHSRIELLDFKNCPTYSIDKNGNVFEHFDPKFYSNYIDNFDNRTSISICLDNLGWVRYNHSTSSYINVFNIVCPEENIFTKEYRDYMYWEAYTPKQYSSLLKLCKQLCDEFDIQKDTTGTNFIEDTITNYNGIIFRANIDSKYLDLNPSFDFKKFSKEIKK